ncbi:MAG: DUF2591 family protein [Rhodocyclaceae bacterium]|nr:DUF2591 family protein [Rhodocyclaceae bacterium]
MLAFKGIDVAKTSELVGVALDWAVAKCEGRQWPDPAAKYLGEQYFKPSTDWAFGGPIIEREGIDIQQVFGGGCEGSFSQPIGWQAKRHTNGGVINPRGFIAQTPLIAAMRCYCQAKLGDEVDVPEEILGLAVQAESLIRP